MSYDIDVVSSESVIKMLLLNFVIIFLLFFPVYVIETVSLFTSTSSTEPHDFGKK